MYSAVITEETKNGILVAARAPTPVSGYTGTKECVEETVMSLVDKWMEEYGKEFARGRSSDKRTKDGLPSMPVCLPQRSSPSPKGAIMSLRGFAFQLHRVEDRL